MAASIRERVRPVRSRPSKRYLDGIERWRSPRSVWIPAARFSSERRWCWRSRSARQLSAGAADARAGIEARRAAPAAGVMRHPRNSAQQITQLGLPHPPIFLDPPISGSTAPGTVSSPLTAPTCHCEACARPCQALPPKPCGMEVTATAGELEPAWLLLRGLGLRPCRAIGPGWWGRVASSGCGSSPRGTVNGLALCCLWVASGSRQYLAVRLPPLSPVETWRPYGKVRSWHSCHPEVARCQPTGGPLH